jgi:hypothetical protein
MKRRLEAYPIFRREIIEGHRWQLWAAIGLLRHGMVVSVPKLEIVPEGGDIDRYSDKADLLIHGDDRGVFTAPIVVECKSRRLRFTTPDSYPYETVFIDRVNTWKRKASHPPEIILFISQSTGKILTLDVARTTKSWVVERNVRDRIRSDPGAHYNHIRDCLAVSKFALDTLASLEELVERKRPDITVVTT